MWWLLQGVALAQDPYAWLSPCMAALARGDEAAWAGDRPQARQHYREAAACGEPEAEAMARLRLLRYSGNWGMLVHGARIDEALMRSDGGWGWLAWSDYYLSVPALMGGDPEIAARNAQQALFVLPGPAASRMYAATQDPRWLEAAGRAAAQDGFTRGLLGAEGAPAPDPGTWTFSLGLAGAPGLGVGGALVFLHPDLFLRGWSTSVSLGGSTRGAKVLSASLRSPGRVYGQGSLVAAHTVVDVYKGEDRTSQPWDLVSPSLALGLHPGELTFTLGGMARWDRWDAGWQAGHGPQLGATWDHRRGWGGDRRGAYVGLSAEASWLDYQHLGTELDLRGYLGLLKGVSAARLWWGAEWAPDAPLLRLPTVGGPELHRGAWAGRYRAPQIATFDLEQRWMLVGPLEGVLFGNLAWVGEQGLHPAGGLGVRLLLPPERLNVVRLDFAVSDSGWSVTTGWGETF